MNKNAQKVRDDALWQDVNNLVQHVYEKVEEIIANFPAEEWATASKIRSSANDSLFYTSQVVGGVLMEMSLYDLNNTRKSLFSMQAMYMFAAKQKFIKLDPEVVTKIDEILSNLDQKIVESKKEIENTKTNKSR